MRNRNDPARAISFFFFFRFSVFFLRKNPGPFFICTFIGDLDSTVSGGVWVFQARELDLLVENTDCFNAHEYDISENVMGVVVERIGVSGGVPAEFDDVAA